MPIVLLLHRTDDFIFASQCHPVAQAPRLHALTKQAGRLRYPAAILLWELRLRPLVYLLEKIILS